MEWRRLDHAKEGLTDLAHWPCRSAISKGSQVPHHRPNGHNPARLQARQNGHRDQDLALSTRRDLAGARSSKDIGQDDRQRRSRLQDLRQSRNQQERWLRISRTDHTQAGRNLPVITFFRCRAAEGQGHHVTDRCGKLQFLSLPKLPVR